MEGKHLQQTRNTRQQARSDKILVENGVPRVVHTIPFTKTAVDKLLNGQLPFGPDSINITDVEKVIYYGKIENVLGLQNFRDGSFSYEQFVVPEWKAFLVLATRPGGPTGRLPWWDGPDPRHGVQ